MMNRIMGESHLEFAVENLQFRADLVHRPLIDLHEIDEFGDFIGGEALADGVHVAESGFHLSGVDVGMSVKYHDCP